MAVAALRAEAHSAKLEGAEELSAARAAELAQMNALAKEGKQASLSNSTIMSRFLAPSLGMGLGTTEIHGGT